MNEAEIKKLKTWFNIIICYIFLLSTACILAGIIIYNLNTANNNHQAEIKQIREAALDNAVTIAELKSELNGERKRNSEFADIIIELRKANDSANAALERIRNRNLQAILVSSQIAETIKNNSDIYQAIRTAVDRIEEIARLLAVDGDR